MVVLDPRRTETAKVADEHHFVRPGTDAWVLLAMLHVLIAEASPTTCPLASYVDGLDTVGRARRRLHPRARRGGERGAGRRRSAGSPASSRRPTPASSTAGSGCRRRAVRHGVPVGGHLPQRAHRQPRPGGRRDVHRPRRSTPWARGLIGRGHHDAWRSRVRGLPESGGELPVSVLREEIETPGEGQVRALLTVAGNPVLSTPDGARLDARARAASTSWSRSTSTSTRPPGTPT